jgi:AraC-like DNA-binding protein
MLRILVTGWWMRPMPRGPSWAGFHRHGGDENRRIAPHGHPGRGGRRRNPMECPPVFFRLPGGSRFFLCSHDSRLTAEQARTHVYAPGSSSTAFALNLVHEGSGVYIDGRRRSHRFGPGQVFCRFPNQVSGSSLDAKPYCESWLTLDVRTYGHLLGLGLIPILQPVLSPRDPDLLRRHFAALAGLPNRRHHVHGMAGWAKALSHIVALLGALHEPEAADPAGPAWLQPARDILADRLHEELYIEQVAAQLGLEVQRFRKQFAAHAGMAPMAYRTHLRIDRACGELRGKSVAEVAAELGFGSPTNFSRIFKRHTGIAPREFQRLG